MFVSTYRTSQLGIHDDDDLVFIAKATIRLLKNEISDLREKVALTEDFEYGLRCAIEMAETNLQRAEYSVPWLMFQFIDHTISHLDTANMMIKCDTVKSVSIRVLLFCADMGTHLEV